MDDMTILLIEDTSLLADLYTEYLREESTNIVHVSTGAEAFDYFTSHAPDIVLLDMKLPDVDGIDILKFISESGLKCCVIVITAYGSVSRVVDAMRLGAFEYLQKPFDKSRLVFTVRNAMERMHLRQIVDKYKTQFGRTDFHGMLGSSKVMQTVYDTIENVASSSATVFITGESGTGKELCAQAVHDISARHDRELVVLNCGAIPKDLMESEIFGHIKGAFTGAVTDRQGAAERANGGTLFLDEICEMDIDLQSKLLRVIQSGTYQKVGSARTYTADIRFICATNRNPLEMVEKGLFREDLYYRLNVIPVRLPALRERGRDKLEIAQNLLVKFAAEEGKDFTHYSSRVEEIIMRHPWPGNVRQLQNIIRNVVVLNDGEVVRRYMLPQDFLEKTPLLNGIAEHEPGMGQDDIASGAMGEDHVSAIAQAVVPRHGIQSIRPLAEVERDVIESAIEICAGNVSRAAGYLDVNPSTLYRKIKTWQAEEKGQADTGQRDTDADLDLDTHASPWGGALPHHDIN
ncbi:sigma-54-dependent transcriptional regulator [Paremcibacter congregatus]|uniref:Sigma-54-dependent Fis family transcriptional regulator n=1 Tax=Paremcibacter congregatus TaxID=2043170 RepID=A0A2G4YM85_9PROT|nr:sigma-54 dependent transcriptional regulator [Paremcibacter congregatus]PHZ83411.1 sigma-54-dependent Fis family transcriptional regulator [Paremcibacter congregatus]QDE28121.1 sigma-54-dependent Fis family transcriptional regulator [Paremcibacter congregatus]